MKKQIIIGNWKMNKNYAETLQFFDEFEKLFQANLHLIDKNLEFALAVPSINIHAFKENKVKELKISSQDVSQHEKGAYTGEISAAMLSDLNVSYAIVGHSERRTYHFETDEIVNKKAKQALKHNITPIVCFGDTIEQYQQGITKEIIKKQVENSLKDLDFSKIIVAYEPYWAVGSNKAPSPEVAQDICSYIRSITHPKILIQYGGNVSASNIKKLSEQPDIDGFLIGGASLKPENFIKVLTHGK